jgi:hypothetical protein
MIRYVIYVDDVAYGGEDASGAAESDQYLAGFGKGWHHTPMDGADTLIWGGDPYVIDGYRNLASHVERIMRRLAQGVLSMRTMRIEVIREGVGGS